jgi:hypothetical protein
MMPKLNARWILAKWQSSVVPRYRSSLRWREFGDRWQSSQFRNHQRCRCRRPVTKFLLCLHVVAALVAIGPVTVAASMFPGLARRAATDPDGRDLVVLSLLRRICRVYAAVGVAIPVFGFATASSMRVLGSAWLIASIVLTAVAAAILGLVVLPWQDRVLDRFGEGPDRRELSRLAMATGLFNLAWAVVTGADDRASRLQHRGVTRGKQKSVENSNSASPTI